MYAVTFANHTLLIPQILESNILAGGAFEHRVVAFLRHGCV